MQHSQSKVVEKHSFLRADGIPFASETVKRRLRFPNGQT
jgi:hypothetical protein